MTSTTLQGKVKRGAQNLALVTWALVLLALVGAGAASHFLSLPTPPPADPRLALAMQPPAGDARWSMLHVLRASCRCSQQIAASLIARKARHDVRERVLVVDGEVGSGRGLEQAGFAVIRISSDALLSELGVEAAPLLVIANDAGEVRYVGGYTARKQGPIVEDGRILADLQRGLARDPLPLFGCPTSRRLKQAIDPFGMR